jgi:ferredoxin
VTLPRAQPLRRARGSGHPAPAAEGEDDGPHQSSPRLGSITTDECIDCGACVPECPVEAIFDESQLPEDQAEWLKVNADKAAGLPVVNQKGDPLPGAEERKKTLGV